MSSPASSCTSSDSRPRGQLAKKFSERLEDNDEHRSDQDEDRDFVEPAEPEVAPSVSIGGEIEQQHAAPAVIARQQLATRHLKVPPKRRAAKPTQPNPDAADPGTHAPLRHTS